MPLAAVTLLGGISTSKEVVQQRMRDEELLTTVLTLGALLSGLAAVEAKERGTTSRDGCGGGFERTLPASVLHVIVIY